MPARLAALTILWRAISSRRLSIGWAIAFSCTVVSDHPLQVLGFDCFDGHSGIDGGFEQQLYAVFVQGFSEVADLCGIAGQAMLVVVHAAEVLPDDVLTPARHQLFVTEVEAVLEVQQTDHQANGQFGLTDVAAPTSDHNHTDAQHVIGFEGSSGAVLVFELGRYSRFDLT